MGLYKILDMALKQGIDHANGKIRRVGSIYRYHERGYTNSAGIFYEARPDATGRLCSRWKKQGVTNCPSPPLDTPRHTLRAGVVLTNVPYFRCMACKHHVEPTRELKYPCCDLLRANRRAK